MKIHFYPRAERGKGARSPKGALVCDRYIILIPVHNQGGSQAYKKRNKKIKCLPCAHPRLGDSAWLAGLGKLKT